MSRSEPFSSPFRFEVQAADSGTRARAGIWSTPHGAIETPAFMPVGTLASVKGLTPDQLRQVGVQKILANTYHLALRPGPEPIAELGGLHSFMSWNGPILTDSGGFQVFSLARLRQLDENGVRFRSHLDGSLLELTPESAVRIQEQLGADCIMCLDECPPADAPREQIRAAVDLTTRWAERCRDAHRRSDQALFGIVQGGIDPEMRERSAAGLLKLDFPGYAVGGLSVGEAPADMYATLDFTVPFLPEDRSRYLMGVGTPEDLLEAVCRGIDLFDCVMPTRNGRNALAFTSEGRLRMRNEKYRLDGSPLDPECGCPVCRQFSRAYLRHLFLVKEMLGPILLSWHNIPVRSASKSISTHSLALRAGRNSVTSRLNDLRPRLIHLLDRLKWQHQIADVAGLAIPDQLYLAFVLEQQKPILLRQRLICFQKSKNVLLFLISQSSHCREYLCGSETKEGDRFDRSVPFLFFPG